MWRSTVIVLMFAGAALAAPGPATSPSTQPDIARWFAGLASPDADLREQSRTNLLGLSRGDLPRLHDLVEQNRPLAPSQMAALHDIVVHLYLSGETYPSDPKYGVLGLRWLYTIDVPRLGVPVEQRLPGFGGFQMLHDGDLILGIFVQPDAPLQQLPNLETPSITVLRSGIENVGSRRDIELEVLRQGQRIRVPIRLRPRPIEPDTDPGKEAFFDQWQKKGEDYWQNQFLPLLRPGVS
jgi:hypothetical protein